MTRQTKCFAYLCNELMRYEDKLEAAKEEYEKTGSYFDSLEVHNYEFIILEIKMMIEKFYNKFKNIEGDNQCQL